ncbi:MAG: FAD-dependent oxidoreductase [Lautropia sp.]
MTDETADVVVLGAGLAGHCAAIEAAAAGASVLVVEKMPEVGGSTVLSGGSFAFGGTPEQAALGIEDSAERFRDDLMTVAARAECQPLIDVYAAEQLAGHAFLKARGVVFSPVQSSSNQAVPRSHPVSPRDVIARLHRELSETAGVRFVTSARARRLVRDAAGKVCGVRVERSGQERLFSARRAVVLATGGFSQSRELMALFAPRLERSLRTGCPGNEGDGLRMAWELGAIVADLDALVPTFGAFDEAQMSEPNTLLLAFFKGGIAVNRAGRRFVDESRGYKAVGAACLEQEGATGFQIFDAAVMRRGVPDPVTFDLQRAHAKGRLIEAESIAALASRIGMDPAVLDETVRTYNEDAQAGVPDRAFGRHHIVSKVGRIFPLQEPPYYAYPTATILPATFGGIRPDARMNVLDVWGRPIPGLFAAGEVTGGLHGRNYMTGTALGKALIFGRIAGRNAAAG